MAQIPFRGNLQAASFPLLSTLVGRSAIDGSADQIYVERVTALGSAPTDRGVPSIVYAHNVMPSTYGWQSVGYNNAYFAPPAEESAAFVDIHFVQCTRGGVTPEPTGTKTYIALGRDYTNSQSVLFVMDTALGNFRRITGGLDNPITGDPFEFAFDAQLTSITLNGVTYLFVSNVGCFLYDDTIDTLLYRELNGLDVADILGITGSNGYMFAWTTNSVAWSSVINVEDFEPSDISGAGGGSLQEAEGGIVTAVPTVHGVLIFTEQNAISVVYSGNEDFPWNFKSIPGSGGVANKYQVSLDQASQYYYAYTTNGIQQLTHLKVNTALPDISDFIAGGVFEDFNDATGTLERTTLAGAMARAVAVIGDRYFVISYGQTIGAPFTHAIVVDLAQGRMGKLKIEHVMCFERRDLTFGNVETPRDTIAFLTTTGLCKALDFGADKLTTDAILLLGKFQLSRSKLCEVQELELENAGSNGPMELKVYNSVNGKDLGTPTDGYLADESEFYQRWLLNGAGVNHTLFLRGTFNIISYVLWLTLHGRY